MKKKLKNSMKLHELSQNQIFPFREQKKTTFSSAYDFHIVFHFFCFLVSLKSSFQLQNSEQVLPFSCCRGFFCTDVTSNSYLENIVHQYGLHIRSRSTQPMTSKKWTNQSSRFQIMLDLFECRLLIPRTFIRRRSS